MPPMPAVGQPVQRLDDLVAAVEAVGPRVEPDRHAGLDVAEHPPRHVRRAGEQHEADDEVADPLGGDPHHHDEQGEEQQRRAEVALADHHDDGEAPGQQDRQQVARLGQAQRTDAPRALGDQLAVLGQVAGEEDGQQQLGELAGLEVDRPEADPDLRPADPEAEPGHERQQQQDDADEQEAPAVAGEVGRPLDDDERGDEPGDGDDAPRRLQAGQAVVEAGDHHVADAVEQGGERQQRAVGAGRQPAHGEVGEHEQPEQEGEERDDAGRDHGELAERGQRVGAGRDEPGHHDERQLGRAPGAGDRRGGGHGQDGRDPSRRPAPGPARTSRCWGRRRGRGARRPWSWSWSSWSSWSSSSSPAARR